MSDIPEYALRIRQALTLVQISQAELARELKTTQQAVTYLCNKAHSSSHTDQIALLTGVSRHWLAQGTEPKLEDVAVLPIGGADTDDSLQVIFFRLEDDAVYDKALALARRGVVRSWSGVLDYPTLSADRDIPELAPGEKYVDTRAESILEFTIGSNFRDAGLDEYSIRNANREGTNSYIADLFIYHYKKVIAGIEITSVTNIKRKLAAIQSQPKTLADVVSFSPLASKDDALAYITRVKGVKLSAGNGRSSYDFETVEESHAFRKEYLQKRNLRPHQLRLWEVDNLSMSPTLNPGDVVLIDQSQVDIKSGKVYALVHHGELRIKRLFRTQSDGVELRSDNTSPEFASEIIPTGDLDSLQILGRAVWKGGDL